MILLANTGESDDMEAKPTDVRPTSEASPMKEAEYA
jgi:hypothetical protein